MVNPLIVANWKMYGDFETYKSVIREISRDGKESRTDDFDAVICPPYPYLGLLSKLMPRGVQLGSQSISAHSSGAFTGEVSAGMVQTLGAKYTLIGHSERRHNFHENGSILTEQLAMATKHDLTPVLCVGENKSEYDLHNSHDSIKKQLDATLKQYQDRIDTLVIAYEPIWAIGSDKSADPRYANEILQIIHEQLMCYSATRDASIILLYGGSVGPENAGDYLSETNIDGLLVGRASLNGQTFRGICENAVAKNQSSASAETPAA